jgi:hypothetical protein
MKLLLMCCLWNQSTVRCFGDAVHGQVICPIAHRATDGDQREHPQLMLVEVMRHNTLHRSACVKLGRLSGS